MSKFEIKDNTSTLGKIKDVDTVGRKVVLYGAAFDNVDSHNDIIIKGAFKKTLAENTKRVKHLWQHETDKPVGIPESMEEDSNGLLIISKISDTVLGRDLLTLIQDGVMSENSIGFQTIKESREEKSDVRRIHEVKLWEYSSVTWGSNEQTPNLGIKSALDPKDQLEKVFKELNTIQKHLRTGNLSDDTCYLLEIKVVMMQQAISELVEKSLTETIEPEVISTPEIVTEPINYKQLLAEIKSAIK